MLFSDVAEAVSLWLPTAAVAVRARIWQMGFVVDKVVSGLVFVEYFGFPCQNPFIPKKFSYHHHHHYHNCKYKRKIEVPPVVKGLMSRHLKEQRALESANELKECRFLIANKKIKKKLGITQSV
jgi:hypothetical protein